MAVAAPVPNPGRDLVRIHRVITRGLSTILEKGREFKQTGFQEEITRQGYCDYARSLAIVLGGHHETEDIVMFPAFQKKIPQAPYDHLSAQHKLIEALLVTIHRSLDGLARSSGDGLDDLLNDLHEITEIWAPHIRMEESIFSQEALSETMSLAEQGSLAAQVGKFSQEHSVPPYLIVPFVLFNVDREDRAAFLANMPPTMLDEMIMKAWKDQWAPMKPFLLD